MAPGLAFAPFTEEVTGLNAVGALPASDQTYTSLVALLVQIISARPSPVVSAPPRKVQPAAAPSEPWPITLAPSMFHR